MKRIVSLVLVLAMAKSTIHNEEELRKAMNLTCLGQIPATKVKRGSCPMYHTIKSHQGFSESVRLLQLQIPPLPFFSHFIPASSPCPQTGAGRSRRRWQK